MSRGKVVSEGHHADAVPVADPQDEMLAVLAEASHEPEARTLPDDGGLRSVCVYCGSASGHDPEFVQQARALGTALASEGIGLVYGGGSRGLMGEVSRATLAGGGRAVGITPDFLAEREGVAEGMETVVVADMHARKMAMHERADAFVALPGGIGTLEEVVEQMTWVQLARHAKPVLLLDVKGFWQPLLGMLDGMRGHGFIAPPYDVGCLLARDASEVVPMLREAVRAGAPA